MKRVSQNPFYLLMLTLLTLMGCGVVEPPRKGDGDTPVGTIPHRDFRCISGTTIGPVTMEGAWPMAGNSSLLGVVVGSTVGQFLVKNQGQKPIRLEGPSKLMLEGSTVNTVGYALFVSLPGLEGRFRIGTIAWPSNNGGILDFGAPSDFATIGGGEEATLWVVIWNGILMSGDVWRISALDGGILYGTAPTCADVEAAYGLKAVGRPVLGQVRKF